jgi:hypothetical protein
MYIGLHVKYPLLPSDFIKLQFSQQIFKKCSNIKFHEIRPEGGELFHADGHTHMTKLTVTVRNFAEAPKKL